MKKTLLMTANFGGSIPQLSQAANNNDGQLECFFDTWGDTTLLKTCIMESLTLRFTFLGILMVQYKLRHQISLQAINGNATTLASSKWWCLCLFFSPSFFNRSRFDDWVSATHPFY